MRFNLDSHCENIELIVFCFADEINEIYQEFKKTIKSIERGCNGRE